MRRGLGTGTGVLVLTACALAVGAGAGYAVSRDDSPVVHACYRVAKDGSPANGATLRAVSASATCRRNERPLTWNLRGPQGPAGAPGADGAPGPAGPAGPPGPAAPADCDLELRIAAAVPGFQTSSTCAPPAPCNDDGFELNDSLTQAVPLDLGTTTSAVACAGNDDYFSIAGVSGVVAATLSFDSNAVLEIALLDSSGNVLASASGSSPQSVSTQGAVTGTVYVRVRAQGNAQGAYTLSL
jgi:hypothetical protein